MSPRGAGSLRSLLFQTVEEFGRDDCPKLAAALAYYTVFSLPPLLVLSTLLAGLFVDPEQVRGELVRQVGTLIGSEGGNQVRTMLREAELPGRGGVVPAVVGTLAFLFGATGAFVQLQQALNAAWNVAPAGGGVRRFFVKLMLKRLFSFAMVAGLGFLFLVSLIAGAVLSGVSGSVSGLLPGEPGRYALLAVNFVVSLMGVTLLLAAIFKVVPDAEIEWADVRTGALVTALLFMAGKFLIGFYLGRSDPGSAYGAAGSLALVLLWIYYSTLILLLGAEFTQVWATRRGKPIRPSSGAVRVGTRGPLEDSTPGTRERTETPATAGGA